MLEKIRTMWGRFKNWFWKILNAIKNLFSSNDASKVNTAKQEGATLNQGEGVKVGQEQGREAQPEPNAEKPELKSRDLEAVPQPEKAKKGEPDVDPDANDDKKPKSVKTSQKKPEGVIMSDHSGNPILVVPEGWIEGLEYFTNPETPGEYLVYIQIGNDAYRITGSNKYSTIKYHDAQSNKHYKKYDKYAFHINSVLKRDNNGEYKENEVVSSNKEMGDMFDLLRTQNVNVTRISGVALHAQAQENKYGLTFMIHNGNLILRSSEDWKCPLRTMFNNPEDDGEYLACVKHGENVYRITGSKHCIQMGREYGFVVNSLLKRGDDRKFNENEVVDPVAQMNDVRDMLDLNDKTTEGNITNIFKATPEVKSPAIPTTTGAPVVDPKITQAQQEVVGNVKSAPGAGQSQSL